MIVNNERRGRGSKLWGFVVSVRTSKFEILLYECLSLYARYSNDCTEIFLMDRKLTEVAKSD